MIILKIKSNLPYAIRISQASVLSLAFDTLRTIANTFKERIEVIMQNLDGIEKRIIALFRNFIHRIVFTAENYKTVIIKQ